MEKNVLFCAARNSGGAAASNQEKVFGFFGLWGKGLLVKETNSMDVEDSKK